MNIIEQFDNDYINSVRQKLENTKLGLKTRQVILFGSGNLGSKMVKLFPEIPLEVVGIVDNNPDKWGLKIENIEITSPETALATFDSDINWVIAIWSPHHSYAKTQQQLVDLGVKNFFHVAELMQLFPDKLLPHYHFQTPEYYASHIEDIALVYNLLSDGESKVQYLKHLHCRVNLDFANLPVPDIDNQYFPADIINLTKEEIFLDAGAFDGDTYLDFERRTNGKFIKYLALEPDPLNFEKFVSASKNDLRVKVLPYAVGRENATLLFDSTGGPESGFNETGETSVEIKKIDDLFTTEGPTFLKFDIEGFESDALEGAREIISKHHPTIAVCLYHLPNDMWTIPLKLKEYYPGYKLYVRTHAFDGFEFVLYALPLTN